MNKYYVNTSYDRKLTIRNIIGTNPTCHKEAKNTSCNRHPKELLAAVNCSLLQDTSRLGGKGHHNIAHDVKVVEEEVIKMD